MSGVSCPQCGDVVGPSDQFCEGCGQALTSDAAAAASTDTTAPVARPCGSCGASVLADGFCSSCGARQLTDRDHWEETPQPFIAGVCDKGIRHARNEDAMALAAHVDRSASIVVVCDGVTTAPESDRASLAAARAACARLATATSVRGDSGTSHAGRVSYIGRVLTEAAELANAQTVAIARTLGDPPEPPSCTFAAAVLIDGLVVVAWCGDSRVYWIPDIGEPMALTIDHSLGTELIRGGMSRADAESDASFHTITRWLGADSVDPTPDIASHDVGEADGWLVVCSDGLWNYASEPAAIAELLAGVRAQGAATPIELCRAMIGWANGNGGHDNITVALVRNGADWQVATVQSNKPSGDPVK